MQDNKPDDDSKTWEKHPIGRLGSLLARLDPDRTYTKREILDLMQASKLWQMHHFHSRALRSALKIQAKADGQLADPLDGRIEAIYRGSHWQRLTMEPATLNPGHPFENPAVASTFFVLMPTFLQEYLCFTRQEAREPNQHEFLAIYRKAIFRKSGLQEWHPDAKPRSSLSILWSWLRGHNQPFYLHSLMQLVPQVMVEPMELV